MGAIAKKPGLGTVTGIRTDTKIVYPPILARRGLRQAIRVDTRSGQNALKHRLSGSWLYDESKPEVGMGYQRGYA